MAATWTLAHNLVVRMNAAKTCYPGIVIGEIGDTAHQAEQSDHNPDARAIVHAIDFMTPAGTPHAVAILAWLLSSPADLEYVIHNHVIYARYQKPPWTGTPYTGSDPHTNHIHASGKHGTVGKNAATGTGYDTAAEAMTPAGSPCTMEDEMPLTDADINKIATAVWGLDGTLTGVKAFPNGPRAVANTNGWSANTGLSDVATRVYVVWSAVTATLAVDVASALVPLVKTGVTKAQVETAVKSAFAKAFPPA